MVTKLVTIGRRFETQDSRENLVALLLECHERIRAFARMAEDVGKRSDLSGPDVVDACQRCTRYFTQALPLHVADEEQSILTRLRGLDPEVDAALDTMHAQHTRHEPLLRALLHALAEVESQPSSSEARRELHAAATTLRGEFDTHLGLEELVILPAIDKYLPKGSQAEIIAELRARRQ